MNDKTALDTIQHLANERHMLYRLAGKQHLTPAQKQRLDEITAQLPVLWDLHRREVAGTHRLAPAPMTLDAWRAA